MYSFLVYHFPNTKPSVNILKNEYLGNGASQKVFQDPVFYESRSGLKFAVLALFLKKPIKFWV